MATGELILVMRSDLSLEGPVTVGFGRYYASLLANDGLVSGHLGPNWLGTYDWSLSVASGGIVSVVTNRGQLIRFQPNPTGGYALVQPMDQKYALAFVGSTWQFTDPLRREIYLFDGTSNLLSQVVDEHGNALGLSYVGGRLSQVSDGLGRTLSFSYSTSGLLTSVSDGTRSVSYAYTGGVLSSVTDVAGRVWTFAYVTGSMQGLLTGVTEPAGNTPMVQSFDPLGRVISQTDAAGGISIYAYDTPTGNTFSDPLGNTWNYRHDALSRLVSLADPASGVTSYAYDPLGRLISKTRPMGDATNLMFDATSGYPSMITLGDGSATGWTYGSHSVGGVTLFDLATASYPDGTSENYGRDAAGNLTSFRDRGSFLWSGTYNTRGQLLTSTNPSGGVTTLTYDTQGRPASGKDNAGNTTHFTYDALSRLSLIQWPDASYQFYAYDNLGHVTNFTDERGKSWAYAYDVDGRLTSETDPLQEVTGFVYDALDRVAQEVDPLGHSRVYAYDHAGRLMSTTDRSGRSMSYGYDGLGRLTAAMDPAGATAVYSYDADSRVISAQDPLGHSTLFAYDALDRVTHVTDPVGTGFDYAYDSMGRLTSSSGPLEATESYGYDSRGLLAFAHKSTVELDFAHTPLGEVSQLTDPNLNAWPRAHDPQGRLTSAADPLSRTTGYTYDSRSRLTHSDLPVGSVDITYDAASRVTGRSFSDGTTFSYAYDDANRLVSTTGAEFAYDAAGRMTRSNGLLLSYDPEGRILSETYGTGKLVTYGYDNRGLLSQVTDWMGGTTSFSYDAAGRLMTETRPAPNGITTSYQYDAADRLTQCVEQPPGSASTPLSTITLTRDALGRPTSIDRIQPLMPDAGSPSTANFSYDAASQRAGLTWDSLGRLLGDGSRTFHWDGASRLKHYAAGTDSEQFSYDAFGQVIAWSQGSQTGQQAWNFGNSVATLDDMQVNSSPPRIRYYVHAPSGLLLYTIDDASGARTFYHYDESGNTMFLTDDAGSVVTKYAYTPFGGMTTQGTTGDPLPFTLQAAAGVMQLGSSGLFATTGSAVFDAKNKETIVNAGVFMHELGHNLGLPHGSGTDHGSTRPREDCIGSIPYDWLAPEPLEGALGPPDPTSIGVGLSERVAGNLTEYVTGNRTESVNGNGTVHVKGDRTEHVAKGGTLRVGDDASELVGGDRTEHVGSDHTENVGGGRMVHVGAEHTESVEGNQTEHVSFDPTLRITHTFGVHHVHQAFEINDWSFEIENPTTIGSATGGAGGGKAEFNEFTIKKVTDAAAPAFFKHCVAGAHYQNVVISKRHAGGDPGPSSKSFLQFKFQTVFTTKIDWSGPGDEGPEETVTFQYGAAGVRYTPYVPGGTSSAQCMWCVK
jgi:YD repeat-containing protein